jgi:DHA1 family tetracycline resistance protein-like MFS transporter
VKKAPLLVVFLTVFIDLLGFGMVVPLLARYGRNELGASSLVAGALVGVYSLMQFVFAPVWGALSDRVGRKPVLTWTLAGNALSYTLYAVSSSLTLLFVSRALSGLFAANISTAQAYVADVTTPADRARGMGLIGMAFGLGFVLGPTIGGVLGAYVGGWAPGAAAALLSATACALAFLRLPESLPPERRRRAARARHPILDLRERARAPGIAGLLLLQFLLVFGFANLESMASLFLNDRFGFDEAQTGYVFAYVGVWIAFAQGFLVGRLARRFGERRLLVAGPLSIAIGLQLYWLAPTIPLFLAAIPFVAVGMGISNPSLASLLSKRTPPGTHGAMQGLSQSLGALARFLSPPIAGWLYGRFPRERGSVAPFVAGSALILLGLVLGRKALRPMPRDAGGPDAPPPVVGA